MVKLGIDIQITDVHGRTAFTDCLNHDLDFIYEHKIQIPIDVNSKDYNGCTLLSGIISQRSYSKKMVQILIERGADVNAVDKCGRTALHHAVMNNDRIKDKAELVSILTRFGINGQVKDIFGKKAFQHVTSLDQTKLRYSSFMRSVTWSNEHEVPGSWLENYEKMAAKLKSLWEYYPRFSVTGFLEVLSKLSPEFVVKILKTKGVGIVDGVTEFTEIQEQIDLLVNRIAEKLSANESPFKFRAKLSGGVSEHCKVGLPDEFDYLLFIDGLERFFNIHISDKAGWATLQRKGKQKHKLDLEPIASKINCFDDRAAHHDEQEKLCDKFVNEYGVMEPLLFVIFFNQMVYETLRDGSVWDGLNFYWWVLEHEMYSQAKSKANFMLEFTSHVPGFKDILISIDLVPVVNIPVNIMPQFSNELSCPSLIAEKGQLLVLLMKGNENARDNSEYIRNRFRVSTSLLETEIIKNLPAAIRKAYMLLKIMKESLSNMDYSNLYFQSYHFKTTLLHVASYAETMILRNGYSEGNAIIMIVQNILSKMRSFWKDQYMPSYFFSENNLLEDAFKDLPQYNGL